MKYIFHFLPLQLWQIVNPFTCKPTVEVFFFKKSGFLFPSPKLIAKFQTEDMLSIVTKEEKHAQQLLAGKLEKAYALWRLKCSILHNGVSSHC